jgi:hypothetical protein
VERVYSNLLLGKAGELRVASELLLRGHEIFLSSVDSGTDIILSKGVRIQVKAANPFNNGNGRYRFGFKSCDKKNGKYHAHALKDVDFVILWPASTDEFFIVPASEIRGRISLCIRLHEGKRPYPLGKYSQYRNKWEILGQGGGGLR